MYVHFEYFSIQTVDSAPYFMELGRFSIESHKTKTKVITPANHKGQRQSDSEPMNTLSYCM